MRFSYLMIAMIFVAATASASWGREPPRSSEAKGAQQLAPFNQLGTEQSPALVKIIPTPKTDEEINAARAEEKKKDFYTARIVWFTALLTFITFFQLLIFGWQGIQLRRSVSAAKEATDLGNRDLIPAYAPSAENMSPHPRFIINGNRLEIQASVDLEGLTNLQTLLERYKGILQLMEPDH